MTTKTRPKTTPYTPEIRAKVLADTEATSAMAASAKHGVPVATIYAWKNRAKQKRGSKKRAAKKAAKRARNGHASTGVLSATLDDALAQIESAGKTIAAIRAAAQKAFGL